jgi:hypothetical protein
MNKTTDNSIPKFQIVWHGHHDQLLMPTMNLAERLDCINKYKPFPERTLRLKLIKPVKGRLPRSVIITGKIFAKARETQSLASADYNRAIERREDFVNDCMVNCKSIPAGRTLTHFDAEVKKYSENLDKAILAFNKASTEFGHACFRNMTKIETLHDVECPGCPWDGETIFNRKE